MSSATKKRLGLLIVLAVVCAGLLLALSLRSGTSLKETAKTAVNTITDELFSQQSGSDIGLHNSTKKFTDPKAMRPADWIDPAEMRRAWNAAIVRVPDGDGKSVEASVYQLATGRFNFMKKQPAVIYLHGCSGFWTGTRRRVKFLADAGFVVIAPASLARKKYPQSCDVDDYQAGMYRPTLKMRQADAGYAIEQLRKLPFVDGDRIVLMGLSQGGITAATFKASNAQQKLRARIIEGWTCNDDWPEYNGVQAPALEPVLALVGADDPWYEDESNGDCERFLNPDNGSVSVVYEDEPLASQHELLEYDTPKREVLKFLRRHVGVPSGDNR